MVSCLYTCLYGTAHRLLQNFETKKRKVVAIHCNYAHAINEHWHMKLTVFDRDFYVCARARKHTHTHVIACVYVYAVLDSFGVIKYIAVIQDNVLQSASSL